MKERKTNRVYSAWDVESVLDGFAREVIKSAESVIPDTFTLIDLLGQIHDIRSCFFECFLDDETRRKNADKNDVESENNPRPAQWDDFSESELADAVEMLLKPDEIRRHAACVALFTAYGITPDTVRLTLAERRGDDKKKLA